MPKSDAYQDSIEIIEKLATLTNQPWVYEVDGDRLLEPGHPDLWGVLGSPHLIVTKSKSSGASYKHRLAAEHECYCLAGVDLLANCSNQLGAIGVIPAVLTNSLILPVIDPVTVERIFQGVVKGCQITSVAIQDGRLAEDAGLRPGTFVLTGTVTGVTEPRLVTKRSEALKVDDVLIGIESSGLHCHGYALVERLIDCGELDLNQQIPKSRENVLDYLLRPTPYYGPAFQFFNLRVSSESYSANPDELRSGVVCVKHGGIMHNLAAIMPLHLQAVIDCTAFWMPPFYEVLLSSELKPKLRRRDIFSLFNGGLGLIWITRPCFADIVFTELQLAFKEQGLSVWKIGELRKRRRRNNKEVILTGI